MRGLGHLRAGGVESNVLTTVHAANEDRGVKVYRFLRDERGAPFLQLIPVIERITESDGGTSALWSSWRDRPLYTQQRTDVSNRSVSPDGYGRFLIDIFEEWVRRDIGEVYVQMSTPRSRTGWRPARHVRALQNLRTRARARTHRRRLLPRPLRRTALPARQHHRARPLACWRDPAQDPAHTRDAAPSRGGAKVGSHPRRR
jgi:hypothetical protein